MAKKKELDTSLFDTVNGESHVKRIVDDVPVNIQPVEKQKPYMDGTSETRDQRVVLLTTKTLKQQVRLSASEHNISINAVYEKAIKELLSK